jgi:hypothetical protein
MSYVGGASLVLFILMAISWVLLQFLRNLALYAILDMALCLGYEPTCTYRVGIDQKS